MSTPYDPKFFVKWIKGMPILVIFHRDDFRWCGPPDLIEEWNKLVAAFEASKYKIKDCTKEPFVGINVTIDDQGNYYLDQKKAIEGVVKVSKLGGEIESRLPYPLEGESLSTQCYSPMLQLNNTTRYDNSIQLNVMYVRTVIVYHIVPWIQSLQEDSRII